MAVSAVAGAAANFGAVDVAGALLRAVGDIQMSAGDGDVDAVLNDGMVTGAADDLAFEAQVVLSEVRVAADLGQLDGDLGQGADEGRAGRIVGNAEATDAAAGGVVGDDRPDQIQIAGAGTFEQTNFSHGFSTS